MGRYAGGWVGGYVSRWVGAKRHKDSEIAFIVARGPSQFVTANKLSLSHCGPSQFWPTAVC